MIGTIFLDSFCLSLIKEYVLDGELTTSVFAEKIFRAVKIETKIKEAASHPLPHRHKLQKLPLIDHPDIMPLIN